MVDAVTRAAVGNDIRHTVEQLLLPQTDLRGMHAKGRRQIARRAIAFEGGQRHLHLE